MSLRDHVGEVKDVPRGVTCDSSVILSPEHYMDLKGILIEEPEDE